MHWKNWLPAAVAIGLCAGCGSNNPPIVKSNTTTTITASATKATTGGSISFSATVTQQPGAMNAAPTGTVTFLSGSSTVGTANLGSGGMATLNITALSSTQLALGNNTVTASYAGDTYNNSSQSSGNVSVAVIAGTTTNLAAAPTALEKGQVGNLVANITRNDATGAPTGSVTFSAGSQTLGTVTLDGNGQAVLPITSVALAIGSYPFSAGYAGDSQDVASSGSATLAVIAPVKSPADVLTHHNNVARTGVQSAETALTPANVNSITFGKLYGFPVDGNLYAAPLWVGALTMSDGKQHNVVFVATTNATVYAFDADGNNPSSGYLWKVSLLADGEQAVAKADYNCNQPGPASGVIGTPVIDRSLGVLYVIGRSKSTGSGGTQYFQRLHALSIGSGIEALNGPTTISAQVKGTGDDSVNGVVAFNPLTQNQRAALLEAEGAVWIVWASHCDNAPYHGWTMAYDADDISQQIAVYNDTPNGSDGGIWMSAGGPSADGQGNVYTVSGNGTYDVNSGGEDYADTINRLNFSGGTISLADSFTPSDQAFLSQQDLDLGTSSPLLFDDPASGVAPELLVTTDKSGKVYLVNRANLGKYDAGPKGKNADIEDFILGQQVYGSLAYFNGRVYVAEAAGPMVAFTFTPGTSTTPGSLQAQPSVSTNLTFAAGEAGGSQPVVSANGTNNGIVWGLNYKQATAVVYAFDPVTLAELWDSTQAANGRDLGAGPVSFTIPVIANGKVYVGNQNQLTVYGLLGK